MRIYVASSWHNDLQPEVVEMLRSLGHDVFDFREPRVGDRGFHWSEIDPEWRDWTPDQFRRALLHPIVDRAFASDMAALALAQAVVLVLPCGRSAHLELGYAIGAGKRTAILLDAAPEPETMYRMVDHLCADVDELLRVFPAPLHTGDTK